MIWRFVEFSGNMCISYPTSGLAFFISFSIRMNASHNSPMSPPYDAHPTIFISLLLHAHGMGKKQKVNIG